MLFPYTTSEPSNSRSSNSDQLSIFSMYQPLLYSILILRCPPPLYDQYHAMASSTPTTSIPIQEPVFQQFVHDVHHAYLLLHRAMALLPPTMIPDTEPTPLPSTGVWNQPEGFQPEYSDATNAFLDNVHLPSPDPEEEENYMDDLTQYHLPRPHQHLAAPPPDALPEPLRPRRRISPNPLRKLPPSENALPPDHHRAHPALCPTGHKKKSRSYAH